jgi:hypothetical protein
MRKDEYLTKSQYEWNEAPRLEIESYLTQLLIIQLKKRIKLETRLFNLEERVKQLEQKNA